MEVFKNNDSIIFLQKYEKYLQGFHENKDNAFKNSGEKKTQKALQESHGRNTEPTIE